MDQTKAGDNTQFKTGSENTPELTDHVVLDPDGDAILVVEDPGTKPSKSFLVSSKILSLASPVFASLFKPHFVEGIQTRRGDCPKISLREDDPDSMSLILSLLHHKTQDAPDNIEAKNLAILAMNCDKYDCSEALRSWILQWCSVHPTLADPRAFGYMLLAAYLFESDQYSHIAGQAGLKLTPEFASVWEKSELMSILPKQLQEDLAHHIRKLLLLLQAGLEMGEIAVRGEKGYHKMPVLVCVHCGSEHSDAVKKCHCQNPDLIRRYCSSEFRVSEYFRILRQYRVWPITMWFTDSSVSDITSKLGLILSDNNHSCEAGKACALIRGLRHFHSSAETYVKTSTQHRFDISPAKDDDEMLPIQDDSEI